MKFQIRNGLFETNSSSVHSLSILDDDEVTQMAYEKTLDICIYDFSDMQRPLTNWHEKAAALYTADGYGQYLVYEVVTEKFIDHEIYMDTTYHKPSDEEKLKFQLVSDQIGDDKHLCQQVIFGEINMVWDEKRSSYILKEEPTTEFEIVPEAGRHFFTVAKEKYSSFLDLVTWDEKVDYIGALVKGDLELKKRLVTALKKEFPDCDVFFSNLGKMGHSDVNDLKYSRKSVETIHDWVFGPWIIQYEYKP